MKVRRFYLWLMAGSAVLLALFWLVNRFDSPPAPPAPAAADLVTAAIDTDNGFYWLVNLNRDAGDDVAGTEVLAATRRRYEVPGSDGDGAQSPTDPRWMAVLLRFPVPGLVAVLRRNPPALDPELAAFDPVLVRYARMLECAQVADFTPPDPRSPVVPLAATRGAARLWLARAVRSTLAGDPAGGAAQIQAHVRFCQDLVAGSRGVLHAMIGMALLADGLQAMAEVAAQPEFPPDLAARVEQDFAPWTAADLPLRNALLGEYLGARRVLDDPSCLGGTAQGPRMVRTVSRWLTYQPGRTEGYLREWLDGTTSAQARPPFQNPPLPALIRSGDSLWWVVNGYGKSVAETTLPDPEMIHQRLYLIVAWHDMAALAARWRARLAPEATAPERAADLAASGRIDPFSGGPYRYSEARRCLYSVAENGQDDGGDRRLDLAVAWAGPASAAGK